MAVTTPEQPPQAPRRTNRLAIASLVSGMLAIWFYWILIVLSGIWMILPIVGVINFSGQAAPSSGWLFSAFMPYLWITLYLRGIPIFLALLLSLAGLIAGRLALVPGRKKGGAENGRRVVITGTIFAIVGVVIGMPLSAGAALILLAVRYLSR